jgi:hypothetical protein
VAIVTIPGFLSLSLLLIAVSISLSFFFIWALAAAAVCQVDEQLYAWANHRLTAQLAAIDPRIQGTGRGPTESLASRRAALARAKASLADECSGLAAGSAAASAAASEGRAGGRRRRRLVGLQVAQRARGRTRLAVPNAVAAGAAGNATRAASGAAAADGTTVGEQRRLAGEVRAAKSERPSGVGGFAAGLRTAHAL